MRRTRSASDELRAYPKDLLRSPLDVTHATADARAERTRRRPACSAARRSPRRTGSPTRGFASLVGRQHLSALVVLVSLALAVFWGAAHALSPGHGKTIVVRLPRRLARARRGTPRCSG